MSTSHLELHNLQNKALIRRLKNNSPGEEAICVALKNMMNDGK